MSTFWSEPPLLTYFVYARNGDSGESAHESSVLIRFAKKPSLNFHADLFIGGRCLLFGLSLPLLSYFVYARSKDSGDPAHAYMLV